MTRRSLLALAVVTLIVSISIRGTSVHATEVETQIFHLSKTFTDLNPCTGGLVTGTLSGTFVVQAVMIGDDRIRAILHASSHGMLTDADGNVYHASFEGNEQFDIDPDHIPASVDVPLHAVMLSTGSAPNFTADGIATVYTNGAPVDLTFTPSC